MNKAKDFTAEIPAPLLEEIDGKPALQLPGDNLLLGDFAAALGEHLSGAGVFARQGCAFTLDHQGQKLEPVTPEWLRTWIERHVVPFRSTEQKDGSGKTITVKIKKSISKDVASAVNVSPQFLDQLPKVERFNPCPMPVMRADGRIELLAPGMDAESKTFTAEAGFTPEIMPIAEAADMLRSFLAEFAWPDDDGRSLAVHIAAMLTVFAGGILPRGTIRPVFLYLANCEGAGKTLLASLAGIPYAEPPPAEAAPNDKEEWRKKLLALTVSGRRLVLLDNLKGHLDSGVLEAYVTSATFTDRILGITKEFTGEAGATLLLTGNRLTISPDMRRRSLPVELFMPELRAEDRKFKRILDAETIRAERPAVVSALWSIVRAWDEASRPPCSHENASFPRWSHLIAGMVEHAGFGSPLAPAEIEGMGDTDTADFAQLVKGMKPGTRYTFEDVVEMVDQAGLFEWIMSERDKEELSRAGKRRLAGLLTRYDRRRVTATGRFAVEGKGRNRRYAVRECHDRHDRHDVSPPIENTQNCKRPEHDDSHDGDDTPEGVSSVEEKGDLFGVMPDTGDPEDADDPF